MGFFAVQVDFPDNQGTTLDNNVISSELRALNSKGVRLDGLLGRNLGRRSMSLVLTLNNFSFDGEHYQKISGVAMETKMGSNYANLFVGFVEKQIFEQYTDPILDYLVGYIDDCAGTASCSCGKLECFINYVNNFHPALQFTWEISETSVSFLDILVSINGNRLTTSVFYKPTDSHSYLLYSSSHSNYTKQSIPFFQLLCLRCLCSEDEDFQSKSLEMREFLSNVAISPLF